MRNFRQPEVKFLNLFKDDKDEDNINACIEKNNNKLGQCILNCDNDSSCETDCVSRFKNDHSKCPCQVDIGHFPQKIL